VTAEATDAELVDRVQKAVDYRFADATLAVDAVTHRSFCAENTQIGGQALTSYERVEFLGDAVLEVIVSDFIFRNFGDYSEGQLAKLRAAVVNESVLATIARSLSLGPLIRFGVGEARGGGADKPSILADVFEALLGAIYLDAGIGAATSWCQDRITPHIWRILQEGDGNVIDDAKSRLLERVQSLGKTVSYEVTTSGPAHAPNFDAVALVNGNRCGTGSGATKRAAEYQAAEATLRDWDR
jgi:ribonuclease-3